jgi:transposase
MGNATNTTENLREIVAEKDVQIAELEQRKVELEALVKYYEEQLRLAKHRQFGSSSEKGETPDQLGLFDETENTADPKAPEPEIEEITYSRRKHVGKREDDLSALPVETVEYALLESERVCPECSGALHEMAKNVRRELKIIPAQVKVVEHRQAVYACRHCQSHSDHTPIVKAPVPEPVIKGSLASPSMVAHIMHQKYVMSVPLYRQEQALLREGISLSRQTMANWVIRASEDWLWPVYEKLRLQLLSREVLHADETVCQVLREPGKKANTNSYMWLYGTGGDATHPIVLYEYQPTRSSAHPKHFLSGWKGYLHADGYPGYHNLPPEITVIGCWVHMRRKFTDMLKSTQLSDDYRSLAQEAVERIGVLFHMESLWKDKAPEARHELRLKESKPAAEAFFAWLGTLRVLPKSTIGIAVNYALGQRKWLMNIYLDGRLELSNNRAENAIRPFVVGRKNWLFCNSQKGARASAIVYSFIETAKANGLKPFDYLQFLLEVLPNTTTGCLDALLPWGELVPDYCRASRKV